MIRNIDARDLTMGLLLIALSMIGLYINQNYQVGTAGEMGPGYMPMVVLLLLAFLGLGLAVTSLNAGPVALESWAWRELSLVLLALILFGVLLEHIGMAASVAILVVVGALADRSQTVKGVVGLACFLVALCWLVFSWGLGLELPFLPPFLT